MGIILASDRPSQNTRDDNVCPRHMLEQLAGAWLWTQLFSSNEGGAKLVQACQENEQVQMLLFVSAEKSGIALTTGIVTNPAHGPDNCFCFPHMHHNSMIKTYRMKGEKVQE